MKIKKQINFLALSKPIVFGFFVMCALPLSVFAESVDNDLLIDVADLKFSRDVILKGEAITVYVRVRSHSKKDLRGVVKFYDETLGKALGSDQSFAVLSESSADVFVETKGDKLGEHEVKVSVVPWQERGDNPENNVARKSYYVDIDTDKDGIPNRADPDDDNDGTPDVEDDFPLNALEQFDTDKDGIGNNQDPDDDNDNHPDDEDMFPKDVKEWSDVDGDGIGDNADPDDDDDGLLDTEEEELGTSPFEADTDGDGVNDNDDDFPLDADRSSDADQDGIDDDDDDDDDNDGYDDEEDVFPLDAQEWLDSDNDGIGNNADTDDDNDGVFDEVEAIRGTDKNNPDTDGDGVSDKKDEMPLDPNETKDFDKDGIGDNEDDDDDNDGVPDGEDKFPKNAAEAFDQDNDGIGNNEDRDDDNDKVEDPEDAFPLDFKEWSDKDQDGLGDNADPYDDNQGPIPSFTYKRVAYVDEKITFDASATRDPDGEMQEFIWNFGDAEDAVGQKVIHNYRSPGEFVVRLRVTDDRGEYRELEKTIVIQQSFWQKTWLWWVIIFLVVGIVAYVELREKKPVMKVKKLGKKKKKPTSVDKKKVVRVKIED